MDPDTLEEGERKQRGIKLLSTNLRQALDSFTADQGAHTLSNTTAAAKA